MHNLIRLNTARVAATARQQTSNARARNVIANVFFEHAGRQYENKTTWKFHICNCEQPHEIYKTAKGFIDLENTLWLWYLKKKNHSTTPACRMRILGFGDFVRILLCKHRRFILQKKGKILHLLDMELGICI